MTAKVRRLPRKERPSVSMAGLMVVKAMFTTGRRFNRALVRPFTVIYPMERMDDKQQMERVRYRDGPNEGVFMVPGMWENWRGMLANNVEVCVGCGTCSRACPNNTIEMVRWGEKRVPRPQINMNRCMLCGICAEKCPTKSLVMTNVYELADRTRDDNIYSPEMLDEIWHTEQKRLTIVDPHAAYVKERPEFIYDACTGCGQCVRNCPTDVIDLLQLPQGPEEKRAKRVAQFSRMDDCIGCSTCSTVCRFQSIFMVESFEKNEG